MFYKTFGAFVEAVNASDKRDEYYALFDYGLKYRGIKEPTMYGERFFVVTYRLMGRRTWRVFDANNMRYTRYYTSIFDTFNTKREAVEHAKKLAKLQLTDPRL